MVCLMGHTAVQSSVAEDFLAMEATSAWLGVVGLLMGWDRELSSGLMFLTFIASFHVLQERKIFENLLEDNGHKREEEKRSENSRETRSPSRAHVEIVDRWARRRIAEQVSGGRTATS